jgi:hypothetical protein
MPLNHDVQDSAPTPAVGTIQFELIDGVAFYRGSKPFEELELPPIPADMQEDYKWAESDPQVQKEYAGLVVAVRHHRIWGAGKTYRLAEERALSSPGCPTADELLYVHLSGAEPMRPTGTQ